MSSAMGWPCLRSLSWYPGLLCFALLPDVLFLLYRVPTWLVASTECGGRKSSAIIRDEKAHQSGQVEVNVCLFLVSVISLS
jgi:hypothetical protein